MVYMCKDSKNIPMFKEMERKYEQKNMGDAFGMLIAIAMALVFCLMITLCSGCKTKYIVTDPVIVHERDSIYKVNTLQVHDTLIYRDSVFHMVKGDTVLIEKWHYLQNANHVAIVDTVYRDNEKEIPVPYPKPYPVEKELSWWEKLCINVGEIAMIAILLIGGLKIYKRFYSRRTQ